MARQKLGQHFLVKGKVLARIARAACGEHCELAVEIGPGRGALTSHLLELTDKLVAVELDPYLAGYLRDKFGDRLTLIEENALTADLAQWGPGVLAGNLPYYAATEIITRFLHRPGQLRQAVFLIQKEVAERITASPGTRDYGYLSVRCQLLATTEYLSTVAPGAFQPPPKVDSAIIRLTPRPSRIRDIEGFLEFASACFRQKRKTLRNNLLGKYEISGDADLSRRAEQVPLPEMIDLFLLARPTAPTRSEPPATEAEPIMPPAE